jgi:hypothetical protein
LSPLVLALLQTSFPDTLQIHSIPEPPSRDEIVGQAGYGPPQLRLRTRQGAALIWLLRSADTFFVAVSIPDTTPYWGDDFVLSIDTGGDGDHGSGPQHDDFQWYLRRSVDSSVVFRGRNGRWEPPKGDPDWRLGRQRSGGGWELSTHDGVKHWSLLLRLDPAWLLGSEGRLPRVAFRIFDDDPQGWFAWPLPPGTPQASSVEQRPDRWIPIR